MSTDFDVLARIRKIELVNARLKDELADIEHRISELERSRRAPDLMNATMPPCPMPSEYDGHKPIWPTPEITDHEQRKSIENA